MNIALLIAAGICFFIACVHTFFGTRTDARHLLNSAIPEPAKSTLYYCWHLVTIILFTVAGMFAWSAFKPDDIAPAMVATLMTAAFGFLGLLVAILRKRSVFSELPQGLIFVVLSGVGLSGIVGDSIGDKSEPVAEIHDRGQAAGESASPRGERKFQDSSEN